MRKKSAILHKKHYKSKENKFTFLLKKKSFELY